MRCPKCNSLNTKKNGIRVLRSGNRSQEFKCSNCERYFTIQINVSDSQELTHVEPGDILSLIHI